MEQIAHGVDEHKFRRAPVEWLHKLVHRQSQIEPLFIGVPLDAAETLRESFGVAMLTARADLGAATDGIPGGVGPFDVGV